MRVFISCQLLRLLDDLDTVYERNVEKLIRSCGYDAEDHYEKEATVDTEIKDPAYERNTADEDTDNGICTEADKKEDSVVYMVSDKRAGVIRSDKKSEEPEQSEVSKDREQFRISCELTCIRLAQRFFVVHNSHHPLKELRL